MGQSLTQKSQLQVWAFLGLEDNEVNIFKNWSKCSFLRRHSWVITQEISVWLEATKSKEISSFRGSL